MLTNPIEQRDFVELIETLMVYKLPHKSREEIEAMLGLSDLKETKVYQEAKQEGIQEITTKIVPRLQHLGMSVEQIAAAVDMSIDQVQQLIQDLPRDSSPQSRKDGEQL